jgi:DNA-binding MarR family transcriptional regulator
MASEQIDPATPEAGRTARLDETVHQRVRLGVLTIANEARRVEFRFLQETMRLTAGNLSQHIRVLEEAGFVRVEKGLEGRRPRTWVAITRDGKAALREEIAALKVLVDRFEGTSGFRTKSNDTSLKE